MHSQEYELTDCCDCGATIVPATDRAFALNDNEFLCFDCAVRRGGAFDAAQERWTVPPDVANVPDERRAHP
jgi:recombinational DNA repair protein (RecF pathway)